MKTRLSYILASLIIIIGCFTLVVADRSGGGGGGGVDQTTLAADAGSVTVPSISWADDVDGTGTGFYRNAADEIAVAINGVFNTRFSTDDVFIGDGTSSAVGVTATGSSATVRMLALGDSAQIGTTTNDELDFLVNAQIGMSLTASKILDFENGGGGIDLSGTNATILLPQAATLPATCTVGAVFLDTDSDDCADTSGGSGLLCYCIATNTWARIANDPLYVDATTNSVAIPLNDGTAGTVGAAINIKKSCVTETTNSGAATETITNVIPAGVTAMQVTCRVTTILAGTSLTTWSLGDGVDVDLYGTALALAAGTTVDETDYTASPLTQAWSAAAQSLTMTAAAGQFDTGSITCCAFYLDSTAATS